MGETGRRVVQAIPAIAFAVFIVVEGGLIWALGVVLLGERLLGGVLSGIAQLSPQWLARTAYGELGPDADELLRSGVPSGSGAIVRLAIITVVCLVLAVRRVRRLRLVGVAD